MASRHACNNSSYSQPCLRYSTVSNTSPLLRQRACSAEPERLCAARFVWLSVDGLLSSETSRLGLVAARKTCVQSTASVCCASAHASVFIEKNQLIWCPGGSILLGERLRVSSPTKSILTKRAYLKLRVRLGANHVHEIIYPFTFSFSLSYPQD